MQSEGFVLCSPGRKLKPVGVVICSEAINSWGCFSPISDPECSLAPPISQQKVGGNWRISCGLRILKPLYVEMLAFLFVFLPLGFIAKDMQKASLCAIHCIDCYKLFHL